MNGETCVIPTALWADLRKENLLPAHVPNP